MMRHGTLYLGILVAVALCGTARAADLFTPSLLVPDPNTERFICMATNVGAKAQPIHVELINSETGVIAGSLDCPAVAPGKNCFTTASGVLPDGYCRFSSKAKLRGAIWVQRLSDSTILSTLPATK